MQAGSLYINRLSIAGFSIVTGSRVYNPFTSSRPSVYTSVLLSSLSLPNFLPTSPSLVSLINLSSLRPVPALLLPTFSPSLVRLLYLSLIFSPLIYFFLPNLLSRILHPTLLQLIFPRPSCFLSFSCLSSILSLMPLLSFIYLSHPFNVKVNFYPFFFLLACTVTPYTLTTIPLRLSSCFPLSLHLSS